MSNRFVHALVGGITGLSAIIGSFGGAQAEVPPAGTDIKGKAVWMAAGARLRYNNNLLGRVYTQPKLPLQLMGTGECKALFCPVEHNKVQLYASRLRIDLSKPSGAFLTDRTLRQGDDGADVTAVQNALSKKGYSTITADGKFGRSTHNAVVDFQRKSNVTADGAVGPETRKLLGI